MGGDEVGLARRGVSAALDMLVSRAVLWCERARFRAWRLM